MLESDTEEEYHVEATKNNSTPIPQMLKIDIYYNKGIIMAASLCLREKAKQSAKQSQHLAETKVALFDTLKSCQKANLFCMRNLKHLYYWQYLFCYIS